MRYDGGAAPGGHRLATGRLQMVGTSGLGVTLSYHYDRSLDYLRCLDTLVVVTTEDVGRMKLYQGKVG